jgi:hypothetical protein
MVHEKFIKYLLSVVSYERLSFHHHFILSLDRHLFRIIVSHQQCFRVICMLSFQITCLSSYMCVYYKKQIHFPPLQFQILIIFLLSILQNTRTCRAVILVDLYGCEMWFLILKVAHKLINMKVSDEFKALHNEELRDLYMFHGIVRRMKCRRVCWPGNVARWRRQDTYTQC